LTAWQRVQLSRHPSRPYTLDHVKALCGDSFELHGHRGFKDDKAMIGGLGKLVVSLYDWWSKRIQHEDPSIQKLWDGKSRRISKSIAFDENGREVWYSCSDLLIPWCLSLEAEERGQGEAIARNIFEMVRLKVPIITVLLVRELRGALGIGVGDRVYMLKTLGIL
jgi:acetyl-CoA carboxylase carboxyl transferase subunit alpha